MRFSTIALIPFLLTSVLSTAIPADQATDNTDTVQIPAGNALTALPHEVLTTALTETDQFGFSCIFSCGAVLGAAACIAVSIDEGNTAIAGKCLKGGAGKLCPCAKCIPRLKDFVNKHHLC